MKVQSCYGYNVSNSFKNVAAEIGTEVMGTYKQLLGTFYIIINFEMMQVKVQCRWKVPEIREINALVTDKRKK